MVAYIYLRADDLSLIIQFQVVKTVCTFFHSLKFEGLYHHDSSVSNDL